MKIKLTPLKKNETGLVSIIVVMIIIMILTLIVLAMSRNANREQRQSLDRQLSSQAFYAAESGINDTVNYLRGNLSTVPVEKTKCDNSEIVAPAPAFPSSPLTLDGIVKYTCVLYNLNPTTLEFGNVGANAATTLLENATGLGINSLTISWDDPDGSGFFNDCPTTNALPGSLPADCSAGMLRLELIDANALNRQVIINNDSTFFIFPRNSGTPSSVNYQSGRGVNQGAFADGSCTSTGTPRKCSVTINNIGLIQHSQLNMRLRTLYKTKSIVIVSGIAQDASAVKFKGAQVVVDSTGKASDVLRRLQVRIPVRPQYNDSDFAIKTMGDLCKLLDVYPGQTMKADSCSY